MFRQQVHRTITCVILRPTGHMMRSDPVPMMSLMTTTTTETSQEMLTSEFMMFYRQHSENFVTKTSKSDVQLRKQNTEHIGSAPGWTQYLRHDEVLGSHPCCRSSSDQQDTQRPDDLTDVIIIIIILSETVSVLELTVTSQSSVEV